MIRLLGSALSGASTDDFLPLKSPRRVPGVKGVPGVLGGAGDSGAEPGSTERFLKLEALLLLIIVMLRVTFISPFLLAAEALTGGDDRAENESYFRSLPSPESGMGPASVSSQSLWRNPITREIRFSRVSIERGLKSKHFFVFVLLFCWTLTRTTATTRGKGQRENKRKFLFYLLFSFSSAKKMRSGVVYREKVESEEREDKGVVIDGQNDDMAPANMSFLAAINFISYVLKNYVLEFIHKIHQ